jgi:hypothetical protein
MRDVMANRKAHVDKGLSMQPALFDNNTAEGALDIDLGFRQCLSRSMSGCGKDRYQIAAEMSRLMKATISKEMLDKYAASDPANGMKAAALTAFCFVSGTFEPFRYLLEPLDADVLHPEDKDLVELARLTEQQRSIEQRILIIRSKRGIK